MIQWHRDHCGTGFSREGGIRHTAETTVPALASSRLKPAHKSTAIIQWYRDHCGTGFSREDGIRHTAETTVPALASSRLKPAHKSTAIIQWHRENIAALQPVREPRYSLGDAPVRALNWRLNALWSVYPQRRAISVIDRSSCNKRDASPSRAL